MKKKKWNNHKVTSGLLNSELSLSGVSIREFLLPSLRIPEKVFDNRLFFWSKKSSSFQMISAMGELIITGSPLKTSDVWAAFYHRKAGHLARQKNQVWTHLALDSVLTGSVQHPDVWTVWVSSTPLICRILILNKASGSVFSGELFSTKSC